MNEEELMKKLASRARLEQPPQLDVADKVMAALYSPTEEERVASNPLAWVAAASAALAIVVAVLAIPALDTWTDIIFAKLNEIPWGIL